MFFLSLKFGQRAFRGVLQEVLMKSLSIKNYFKRKNTGSVLAEAALTIPLIAAITFFIVEFGNVLYLSNSLNQITRSAARFASVTPSYTNSQLIQASGAQNILPNVSRLTLNITPASGTQRNVGATITVTAQYNYTPIINPFKLLDSNYPWMPQIMSVSTSRSEVANAP